jgi:hypothetical protein
VFQRAKDIRLVDVNDAVIAKAAADAANADIAIISSDNILSKGEKPAEVIRWNSIVGEVGALQTQADAFSVSRTSFDAAYSTLNAYLTGINTAPAWTDVNVDTPIVGTTYRTNFLNYYNAKAALLIAISAKVQANASAAQDSATAANTAITAISSDNVLSKGEKPQVISEWNVVAAEHQGIYDQATALGLITDRDAFYSTVTALAGYLNALSPAYTNTTADTVIVGATFRAKFTAYYTAKQALINAMTAKASTLSSWQGTTGSGKPSDNASSDIVLVSTNGMTVTGNTLTKTQNTAGWDSGAVSKDSFVGGAFVSLIVGTGNTYMFGLNGSDASADYSYKNIDFAMYVTGIGTINCYESNIDRGQISASYISTDALAVMYNGSFVHYLQNGNILRTVAAVITTPLFFDCSFYQVNASVKNVRFGPMSSNAWPAIGGPNKPADNATVGAPAGTYVAGTLAETLTSQASAGATANTRLTTRITGRGVGSNMSNITASGGGSTITMSARTAVGTGGVGSYKYLWRLDGDSHITIVGSNASASVTLRSTGTTGDSWSTTALCDITDLGSNLTGIDSFDATSTHI